MNEAWLRYVADVEGLSDVQIARVAKVARSTVRYWRKQFGIAPKDGKLLGALWGGRPRGAYRGRARQMVSGKGNVGPGAVRHID